MGGSNSRFHDAVRDDNVTELWRLICDQEDINQVADYLGELGAAPVHTAALFGSRWSMRILCLLGADVNALNASGETARHILCTRCNAPENIRDEILKILDDAYADRCDPNITRPDGCMDGCRLRGRNNGRMFRVSEEEIRLGVMIQTSILKCIGEEHEHLYQRISQGLRLLCLDGGGIKGLFTLICLLRIENEFRTRFGADSQLIDRFDVLSGTSTGGILALALAAGMSVRNCIDLYIQLKDEIFLGFKPYNTDRFRQILADTFGKMRLSDLKRNVLIMVSDGRFTPYEPKIFENIRPAHENPFVRDVAFWTASCPGLFDLVHPFYLDGAFVANNPTSAALSELFLIRTEMANAGFTGLNILPLVGSVISIGTSLAAPVPSTANAVNVGWPDDFEDIFERGRRFWNLFQALKKQTIRTDGLIVTNARVYCSSNRIPYFRIQPPFPNDVAVDERDMAILSRLMYETNLYMLHNAQLIQQLCTVVTGNGIG